MNNTILKNLNNLFKDTRTRTIIIFTGVVLFLGVVIGLVKLARSSNSPDTAAQISGAPSIQSIPGGFDKPPSEEYQRLQEQQNLQQAQLAAQQGTSAIPTIIRPLTNFNDGKKSQSNTGCCNPCPCGPQESVNNPTPPLQASNLNPGTLVYNSQGRVIGTVGADGKVRDNSGNIIGSVGPDGLVRDNNGNIIGSAAAISSGTPAYDAQGKLIGTIGSDGKVRDAAGKVIGTADADGNIRDLTGNVIGKAGATTQGTPVYDSQGRLMGTVGSDGKVHDATGKIIGSVASDGSVVNDKGNVIGRAVPLSAGNTPVYDSEGRLIGTAGPDGKVRNANGDIIGTLGADGTVLDAKGNVVGKASAIKPGSPVYDSKGQLIGTIGSDGKVRNASGEVIGTVNPDGTVTDTKGNILGKVNTVVPGAPVYDNQGRLIGTVGSDGKVRNASGQIIGKSNSDGSVTDGKGNILGKVGTVVPGAPVYDSQGRTIGTVGADGKVRDETGKVIGVVSPDGTVLSPDGKIIGKTGPTVPGTPVYDAQGRLVGTVGADGKVRDGNGKILGTIGLDGNVRDNQGNVIGSTATTSRARGLAPTAAGPNLLTNQGDLQTQQRLAAIPGLQDQNSQLDAIMQRQAQQVSAQKAEQMQQQIQTAMATQANYLMTEAWSVKTQEFMPGQTNTEDTKLSQGTSGGLGNAASGTPVVKAGTMMYAVLVTSLNSDQQGPVLATIVDGKFKGGRLIGTFNNQKDKVLLSFNTLTLPNVPRSISVNTVAVDPGTSRTAFSTYTDNHYLLRYGTLLASSFLQGYGQAYQSSGQSIVGLGQQIYTVNPDLNPRGKFFVALGNVGTRVSSAMSDIFNTPPTIYVSSGTAMGILFMSDVPPLPTS